MPVLDAAGAADIASRGVLVDARAPERFRGETEPIDPVAGHIPGARNLPAPETLERDGTMLPAEVLRPRFSAIGAAPGTPVGVYCGSGVVASQSVLAMARAGIEAALVRRIVERLDHGPAASRRDRRVERLSEGDGAGAPPNAGPPGCAFPAQHRERVARCSRVKRRVLRATHPCKAPVVTGTASGGCTLGDIAVDVEVAG